MPGLGHRHEMGVFRPPDPRGARDCALTRRTALHLSRERERRNVLGRELNVSLQTEEEREWFLVLAFSNEVQAWKVRPLVLLSVYYLHPWTLFLNIWTLKLSMKVIMYTPLTEEAKIHKISLWFSCCQKCVYVVAHHRERVFNLVWGRFWPWINLTSEVTKVRSWIPSMTCIFQKQKSIQNMLVKFVKVCTCMTKNYFKIWLDYEHLKIKIFRLIFFIDNKILFSSTFLLWVLNK